MNYKKSLIILLKIISLFLVLYFVYTKIKWNEVAENFNKVSFINLILAFISINISYYFAAIRLKYYLAFRKTKVEINNLIILSYKCSFFSNFLPGGIGGEGYKLYYLVNQLNYEIKTAVKVIFSDRGSAMLALGVLFLILLPLANFNYEIPLYVLVIFSFTALFLMFLLYRIITKKLLDETVKISAKCFSYSILMQICCICTFNFLISDICKSQFELNYLITFILSCVMVVIPISLGGVGIRELVFIIAAKYIYLDIEDAVSATLIYYFITSISSLIAVPLFINNKRLKKMYD